VLFLAASTREFLSFLSIFLQVEFGPVQRDLSSVPGVFTVLGVKPRRY